MNTIVWIVAGAALAWLAFSWLKFNRYRGLIAALAIGALGAYVGGSVVAPLLAQATADTPGEFRPFAFIVASACAAACLLISDMVYERFGV